jgi:hypothetical protein
MDANQPVYFLHISDNILVEAVTSSICTLMFKRNFGKCLLGTSIGDTANKPKKKLPWPESPSELPNRATTACKEDK